MLDNLVQKRIINENYNFVIITLDSHAAGPAKRILPNLKDEFPNLSIKIHAAADWAENPKLLEKAKNDVASANMLIVNLLFLEEHINAILPSLMDRKSSCDALVGCVASREVVQLTQLGNLDMAKPSTGVMGLLKKLRGNKNNKASGGEKQMALLRRLPKILKFLPGKAQDLRAYFLTMQYWLGGSDENMESMVRFLINKYGKIESENLVEASEPVQYADTGLYHPELKERITTDLKMLPRPQEVKGVVGLLLMRSYILSGDTKHYDAVIRALEEKGFFVIPAFAAGLDGRPAIESYFIEKDITQIDCLLSLTGFSLVGGPAYNDSSAAEDVLRKLDVNYIAAHALEFQSIEQWKSNEGGLGPVETTMLVALPEIDGATSPYVFGARAGVENGNENREMVPCFERINRLADKVSKVIKLKREERKDKKIAVVIYGFPPNSGAIGTAAHLSVFESLYNTLDKMGDAGYTINKPNSVDDLRNVILEGNSKKYGQEANVFCKVSAEDIISNEKYLDEIESVWGPAPGKHQADGSGVYILGQEFGNVFVGVQPTFGYEGDPMRLLFDKGFAPTHAFSSFYRWIREIYKADAVLHFGMHGALEFMPGKKAGMDENCWPDRLIGDLPNIYLYAANNPSEGSLAKRRSGAVIITHLTPALSQSGLYKGLLELKESLNRWRAGEYNESDKEELETLIRDQSEAVNINSSGTFDDIWKILLETEEALIPDGLHIIGKNLSKDKQKDYLSLIDLGAESTNWTGRKIAEDSLAKDNEIPAILSALDGKFISPVPGGDLISSPSILPTGRNMHAFDPFRMPTTFAMAQGRRQAEALLETHREMPKTIAMVLWGSDNIKTDGCAIAQALALIGAKPRFDSYGRLSGADLIPLEELNRPRIDVLMTLSGIFRDLLPLQIKLLADAAFQAATANEPLEKNFVKAHVYERVKETGCSVEEASLRVFSNAEGAYGSNVNQLIDSSSWSSEDELGDTFEARKSYAYGRDGKGQKNSELLKANLKNVELTYQNLESIELGVTTVDHYFDTLGGISRAAKKARGSSEEIPVYIGDQTRGDTKVRTLSDQIALETRSRSLNPKWYEALLSHGHEGVRQIEAQITNTLGWSATTGQVEPWVYGKLSETFVLDENMRNRLAELNPEASLKVANRLLEAHERDYWQPDEDTLEALRQGADELEDRLEGINVAAE